jgi:thiol-disulfide isomerase/thioredoxin
MTLHYVRDSDFSIEKGNLVVNVNGITLLMFYSQTCGHCKKYYPEFLKLVNIVSGINFAVCDVAQCRNAIAMSKNTHTPITSVPHFVLYNEGIPYAIYKGRRSNDEITNFIKEIVQQLNNIPTFQQSQHPSVPPRHLTQRAPEPAPQVEKDYEIAPETGVRSYKYSFGRPYNTASEESYLQEMAAYDEKKMANNRKR